MSGNRIRLLPAFPILQQVQDERKLDPVAAGVPSFNKFRMSGNRSRLLAAFPSFNKFRMSGNRIRLLPAFPSFNKFRMSGKGIRLLLAFPILQQVQDERKGIRFLLLAAIFRYRRPFPAYPAGNSFPLILNFVEGWAG